VAKIAAVSFGHANSDELEQGINPFTVGYRNQDETTEARTQATQHAMLMDGAAPRLADVITLAASEKVRMPRTCIQVSITLDNYRVVLHTCFGPDHRKKRRSLIISPHPGRRGRHSSKRRWAENH
jgi:hypothetical protein